MNSRWQFRAFEVTCFARGSVRHEDQSVREKKETIGRGTDAIRKSEPVNMSGLQRGRREVKTQPRKRHPDFNYDRFQGDLLGTTTRTLNSLLGEGRFAIQ
ncbi:uncharacterized protein APUU_31528S [Aspergillus puulaauensis]|uniref:Uncharacterized protein n=1 Tax=Aspergillus puulaauensis TaxID=1220207 RepID=A0A7R8AN18_9EURO|nr:uncharacterized protein APUU_31528S [Aspergillus puulaauensis]BCS23303.1 hypothetical protein APUU_31528S [Aspergillus puulaauensis]